MPCFFNQPSNSKSKYANLLQHTAPPLSNFSNCWAWHGKAFLSSMGGTNILSLLYLWVAKGQMKGLHWRQKLRRTAFISAQTKKVNIWELLIEKAFISTLRCSSRTIFLCRIQSIHPPTYRVRCSATSICDGILFVGGPLANDHGSKVPWEQQQQCSGFALVVWRTRAAAAYIVQQWTLLSHYCHVYI